MSDEFIANCKNIGSTLYGRIAEAIVEYGSSTDENIADYVGLTWGIDITRAALKDLQRRGLIKGTRVKDEKKGWFVIKYQMVIK